MRLAYHYLNPIKKAFKSVKVLLIFELLYLIIFQVHISSAQVNLEGLRITQFIVEGENPSVTDYNAGDYYLLNLVSDVSFSKEMYNKFSFFKKIDSKSAIVRLKHMSDQDLKRLIGTHNFTLFKVNDKWKFNSDLLYQLNKQNKIDFPETEILFQLQEGAHLQLQGVRPTKLSKGLYKGKFTKEQIWRLSNDPSVIYIGREGSGPKSESMVIDLNLHPNRINAVQELFPSLKGEGHLVSIQEPLYDKDDIDLSGRYVSLPYESEFSSRHATDMATIIGGGGLSFVTGKGVARNVQHTSADNINIVPQEDAYYINNGIYVQNHSYGTSIESFYGALAFAYDRHGYENPTVLHIQSSGNQGLSKDSLGTYANISTYSNLTGNYKHAKNVLTIGSVDTTGQSVIYSSVGPAHDGRIKPELVSYSMAGTSNSAALVSGAAILIRERFLIMTSKEMPAGLLKAVLINSAEDVGKIGPDHKTGFGQLDALRAIRTIDSLSFFQDSVSAGDSKSYMVNIPANAAKFKATLVWIDPPANAGANKALINDLDLEISTSDGNTFHPYVLSTVPHYDSLQLVAKTGKDHLNTIEQIGISAPSPGQMTIKINSFEQLSDSQEYFIVYQYELMDEFEWTSPVSFDNLPYNGETIGHLRWNSSYVEGATGQLFINVLGTEEGWQIVEQNVQLADEQLRWDPPAIYSLAQFKMVIGAEEHLSDTFSISRTLRLQALFNCADSIMLSWNEAKGADQYAIANLQNGSFEPLKQSLDTFAIINKSEFQSDLLTITPVLNNTTLLRSIATDYTLLGDFCYLNSNYAEVKQDSGVFINVELGTLRSVSAIHVQRQVNNTWVDIISTATLDRVNRFLDEKPFNGENFYRVVVDFENGATLFSDDMYAYFVNGPKFIVYPNPISTQEDLKVFGSSVKALHSFELHKLSGESVLKYNFDQDRAYVQLPDNLAEGLYIYRVYTIDSQIYYGKLLIKD